MNLTELEGAALGLVWLRGPTTAYGLRKMIAASPTPQWSASAGTVYPLVEKLSRNGLISLSRMEDRRGTRQLGITLKGKQAFKKWMLDLSPAVIGVPPDPVRTRVRLLGLLARSEGKELLGEFEKHMTRQLGRMRVARLRGSQRGSLSEALALEGASRLQKTRVEWITAARKLVNSREPRSAQRRSR